MIELDAPVKNTRKYTLPQPNLSIDFQPGFSNILFVSHTIVGILINPTLVKAPVHIPSVYLNRTFISNHTNMETQASQTLPLKPTFGSSFGHGWRMMIKYFLELLLVSILVAVAQIPMGLFNIGEVVGLSPALVLFQMFAMAYGLFILGPINYGVDYIFLKAMRSEKFDIKEVFAAFQNYLNVILANLLTTAIILAGIFLLIIPGIIFACKLAFVPYLVMDKKLDPVEAVKTSWAMTRGHAWTIFFMGFVSIFIIIGGLILLFIGVFPAAMWVSSAFASLYHSVDQETK